MKNIDAEKGGIMKNLMICLLMMFVFTMPLYAETDAPQQQTGTAPMPGGPQMHMKCPMMQMHGQGMMQGGQQMQGQGMMQMCPKMGQMMGHGMMARDMMQMMMDMMKVQQKMIRGISPVEKKEMMKETDKMMERMERMMSDMRGMMMHGMMEQPAPASSKEPESKETEKETTPKADPHKH
jgi:hypothetical protein